MTLNIYYPGGGYDKVKVTKVSLSENLVTYIRESDGLEYNVLLEEISSFDVDGSEN